MRKNNEDIYQMFHGLKPVKRDDKKPGQSDWYYIDPRYEEDKARSQIDITNENEPNPRIRAILADDMRKNPEDYYIWRTQKDDRVRGKHAEREGKIFNRHVPPEGGNPGEDYNCRCWEEPYKPDKLNITPKVDLSGLPQYAENDKVGTKNDASKSKKIDYSLYGKGFTKEFIDQMENDEEFQKILNEYIIPNEGGFSDRLNDRGKKTKYGISQKTYYNEDISNITRERANAIIYRDFYDWNGLNKLPYQIRGFVVDYGMPTSPLNAIRTVHRVLNLPPNGNVIGSSTMSKLENFSESDYINFLNDYKKEMYRYYYDLVAKDSSQKENLRGWLNRADRAHLAK